MTKKLTLSMDEDLIDKAKELAAQENTSVSAMFARIVRGMTDNKTRGPTSINPAIRKISGIARLPNGKTFEDLRAEALLERYGTGK